MKKDFEMANEEFDKLDMLHQFEQRGLNYESAERKEALKRSHKERMRLIEWGEDIDRHQQDLDDRNQPKQ